MPENQNGVITNDAPVYYQIKHIDRTISTVKFQIYLTSLANKKQIITMGSSIDQNRIGQNLMLLCLQSHWIILLFALKLD